MDEDNLELVLACAEPGLRGQIRDLVTSSQLTVVEVDSPRDAMALLKDTQAKRAILLASEECPTTTSLQATLDIAALTGAVAICATRAVDQRVLSTLQSMGIQQVYALDELSGSRLRAAILVGSLREHRQRELSRLRDRLSLERDILASLAAAGTRAEVFACFLDGLMALGATGVALWNCEPNMVELAQSRGQLRESQWANHLASSADHPAARCARLARAEWQDAGRTPFHFDAGTSSCGYIPLREDRMVTAVLAIVHEQPVGSDEARGIEALCRQVGEVLRRTGAQAELQRERDFYRQLLGIISHDLRNPLNTMALAVSELSARSRRDQVVNLARVSRAVRTATRLTDDLLTFTKVNSSGLDVVLAPSNIFELLLTAVEDARLRATGDRKVVLEVNATQDEGDALVDAGRIEQAVGNLLSNALAYSSPGTSVLVRASADPHALYVDVENQGSRVDVDGMARLFEPQTRMTTVGERGSLGLGLFVVECIMSGHGGAVWVEAADPEGVRFCLQLPRRLHEQASGQHSSAARGSSRQLAISAALAGTALPVELHDMPPQTNLRRMHDIWTAARGRERLPPPQSIERSQILAYLPDMVTTRVSFDPTGAPIFIVTETGPRLDKRLRGTLSGVSFGEHTPRLLCPHYEQYHRCWAEQTAVYNQVRRRDQNGYDFYRLLLPLSRDLGKSVTDILALVEFD